MSWSKADDGVLWTKWTTLLAKISKLTKVKLLTALGTQHNKTSHNVDLQHFMWGQGHNRWPWHELMVDKLTQHAFRARTHWIHTQQVFTFNTLNDGRSWSKHAYSWTHQNWPPFEASDWKALWQMDVIHCNKEACNHWFTLNLCWMWPVLGEHLSNKTMYVTP